MKEIYASEPPFEVHIHKYQGQVEYFEQIPIHIDKHDWEFDSTEGKRRIPVRSIWNYQHHQEIADVIASGARVVMYMWGNFGTGYLLNSPEWQEKGTEEAGELREKMKIGREKSDKFANFMHPDDMWMFMDTSKLHPDLQGIRGAAKRWQLYQSGPIHLIAPYRKSNPHMDESLLTASDKTASFFYMPHPAMNRIIELVRKNAKHAVFGGGSANPHGQSPAFTTEGLWRQMASIPEWVQTFDMVLVDEITESTRAFIGHTQVRLAKRGSDGVSEIVRYGGVDPLRWAHEQKIEIKEAESGTKVASRLLGDYESNKFLTDARILKGKSLMERFHQKAKEVAV